MNKLSTEILMPKLGLTMTSGVVDEWIKKEGEPVQKGEHVCTISSEKLTAEVEAPADGILVKIIVAEGEEADVKEPIGIVAQEGETIDTQQPEETVSKPKQNQRVQEQLVPVSAKKPLVSNGERIFASPLARILAKEKNIDLTLIKGTGGNNRITKRDIEAYEHSATREVASTTNVVASSKSTASQNMGAGLTGMRKVIAKRMKTSLDQTAQLTIHRKADLTAFIKFKEEIKRHLSDTEIAGSLSLTVCVSKAVILALKEYPEMNSWYEPDTNGFQTFDEVHLGIATALSNGLMVPVIRNAHQMSLKELSGAITKVTQAAREGSLAGELVTGSTFTITNLGKSGIEYFTPILNTPETGILGVGSLQDKLTLNNDGQVITTKELPLSLTFDHQLIDGAPAAEFLGRIVSFIEKPYSLLL